MPDMNYEAEEQLGCLDDRIAQLREEYEQFQLAELVARRDGRRKDAQRYRLRSRNLIGIMSYLISQRSRTEH